MLDVHAHVLPNVDDGAKTLDDSLELLRSLSQAGFRHVVATPHYYPGRYTPRLERIQVAHRDVSNALNREQIPITLLLGRECFFDFELTTAPERESFSFTWNAKRYQLIELPQMTTPSAIPTYLKGLRKEEITPILAHAERYNQVIRDPRSVERFREMGFRIQVDLLSFASRAHPAVKKTAETLLEQDQIHVLASDLHHPSQLPAFSDAMQILESHLGGEEIRRYCDLP